MVITDWAMPGHGRDRARRAGSAPTEAGYTYVMVLTGARRRARRRARRCEAGADDVLAKPLDPAELERGLIAAERADGDAPADARRRARATR